MKNQETWEFAQRHNGKLMKTAGLIELPFSVLAMAAVIGGSEDQIGIVGGIVCGIQVLIWILSIFPTERALKKRFDDNGRKRK